jgi:toxin YoeB
MFLGAYLVSWQLVFTKQAQKDARKLAGAGLRDKAEQLLEVVRDNPFQTAPRYEKLVGDLAGAYSRFNIDWSIKFTKTRKS